MIEKILDAAGQKGTGKWTVVSSLDLGMPVTLVAEAVYARILSALKEERAQAAGIRSTPTVVVLNADGAEVFRAEGVPSLAQVLVAAAKAV